jgi:protein-tyrosine phosphatase
MKKLLFVCLGNICRSPVAQGIAEELYPNYEIDSAGTGSWHVGNPPDKRSIDICKKNIIDISNQKARSIRIADDEYFDLIIGMDKQNILDLKRIFPKKNHHKIIMLDKISVKDPYLEEKEGFKVMFDHIESSLKTLKL